jgi:hypothetical protein
VRILNHLTSWKIARVSAKHGSVQALHDYAAYDMFASILGIILDVVLAWGRVWAMLAW